MAKPLGIAVICCLVVLSGCKKKAPTTAAVPPASVVHAGGPAQPAVGGPPGLGGPPGTGGRQYLPPAMGGPKMTPTPGHPATVATVPTPSPSPTHVPTPAKATTAVQMDDTEIRVDGRIVDITPTLMTISADSYTLPNGRSQRLATLTLKTVILQPTTTVQNRGVQLSLKSLKIGLQVGVIGPDATVDSGPWLTARDVEVTSVVRTVAKPKAHPVQN